MNSPTVFSLPTQATSVHWLCRFFACNPLYLASAGLLLYGINQLSSDASLAGAEPAQITFNFAALFIYEILLVWTAILLARRAIWYDSLLLVGLENLFVLVPFSLVSRAVQLDASLGQGLCVAAAALAGLKFWALRRYIPSLNLPPQLLGWGAVILGANIALALGLRDLSTNPHELHFWISLSWLFGMPLLIGLGNCLPRTFVSESPEQKGWLPYAALGIWIAVTACHLGGVGYVYTFDWSFVLLAPALWALAWTLVLQTKVLVANAGTARRYLLVAPLAVTVFAAGDLRICFALNVLNVAGYAWAWYRHRRRDLLLLGGMAFVVAASVLPVTWTRQFAPGLQRIEWVAVCAFVSFLGGIVASRNPKWTMVGGGLCFFATVLALSRMETPFHWAVQAGLMFCIAHSVRWRDEEVAGARTARILFCVAWMAQSFLWSLVSGSEALRGCIVSAGIVFACYALQRLLGGDWKSRLIPVSALVVLMSAPGAYLAERLKSAPSGYLAMAGSFLLFALGTIAALTKPRWHKNESN